MLTLGRRRGHLMLLAIVSAVVLAACGSSSTHSSSDSSSQTATTQASATKSGHKHRSAAHHRPAPRHAPAHHAPPPPPPHIRGHRPGSAAELRFLKKNPVSGIFSLADSTFTNFVYKPLVSTTKQSKTAQHFVQLRAQSAALFAAHSLIAAGRQASHKSGTASFSAPLVSLGTQMEAFQALLVRGKAPTTELATLSRELADMAAKLKAKGYPVILAAPPRG